jgi:hypothetical protein
VAAGRAIKDWNSILKKAEPQITQISPIKNVTVQTVLKVTPFSQPEQVGGDN